MNEEPDALKCLSPVRGRARAVNNGAKLPKNDGNTFLKFSDKNSPSYVEYRHSNSIDWNE